MNIFKHPVSNLTLTAPPGRPEVVDLPVWRGEVPVEVGDAGIMVPTHVVQCWWEPNEEELALLNNGGVVTLQVYGTTLAPHYVGVCRRDR